MLHNLNGKIMGISHDNATNIKNAVKLFHDQDIYSNRCTTYTLQLAVKKFLVLSSCRPLLKTILTFFDNLLKERLKQLFS